MLPTYSSFVPVPKSKPEIITRAEAIKKQDDMTKLMCPQCNKDPGYMLRNDGASHSCQHCKTVFHYCACYEAVKYGSPGPLMCEDCRKYESYADTHEERERIHFRRYLFTKRLIRLV